MQFHKIWIEQYRATPTIRRQFGVKNALDYLIGEKLVHFAEEADRYPEFAAELPRFQAAIWRLFNPYEIAGYLASLKPGTRSKLRRLLYVCWGPRNNAIRAHGDRSAAQPKGREPPPRTPLQARFGVYLVSISIAHQREPTAIGRPNRNP